MSERECAAVALAKMLADYEEKARNREELKNWIEGFSRDINKAVENLKKGA
jgi:hypothetical protein